VSIECHAKARQGGIVVEPQAVFHAALFATPEEVVIWDRGGGIVFAAGEAMDAYEPHRTRRGQIPVGTPSAIKIYSDSTDGSTLQMGVTLMSGPWVIIAS